MNGMQTSRQEEEKGETVIESYFCRDMVYEERVTMEDRLRDRLFVTEGCTYRPMPPMRGEISGEHCVQGNRAFIKEARPANGTGNGDLLSFENALQGA
jgi:hypothetical protein